MKKQKMSQLSQGDRRVDNDALLCESLALMVYHMMAGDCWAGWLHTSVNVLNTTELDTYNGHHGKFYVTRILTQFKTI